MSSEFVKVDKVIGASPDEAKELNKLHDTPKKGLSKLQKGISVGTGLGTVAGGTAVAIEQGWINPPAIIEQGQKTAQKIDEKLNELGLQFIPKAAEASGDSRTIFQQVWDMSDADVASHVANRSWYWGPTPISGIIKEPYAEAPGGFREVQYWDKARMENNPNEVSFPWAVTNGLLVSEMMNGRIQLGDNKFENRAPANINVAGDPGSDGITYAKLAQYAQLNAPVYPAFAQFNAETSGKWYSNDVYGPGLPITKAFKTTVKVGGVEKEVTVQAFERRVLTETKDNPDPFKVEMGNAGQHYGKWRYPSGFPNTGGEVPGAKDIGYDGRMGHFESSPNAILSLESTNDGALNSIPDQFPTGHYPAKFYIVKDKDEANKLFGIQPWDMSTWDVGKGGTTQRWNLGWMYKDSEKLVFAIPSRAPIDSYLNGSTDLSLLKANLLVPIGTFILPGNNVAEFNKLMQQLGNNTKLSFK